MASRAAIPRVHRNGISGTLPWGRLLTAASSRWLADRTATRVILTTVRRFRWRVRTPLLSTLWPELSNGVPLGSPFHGWRTGALEAYRGAPPCRFFRVSGGTRAAKGIDGRGQIPPIPARESAIYEPVPRRRAVSRSRSPFPP